MALIVLPGVRLVVGGFLTAINVAIAMQRGIAASVTQPIELGVAGEDFARTVNGAAGTDLRAGQLSGVLRGEPATWRGINQNSGQERWDLTDVRLSRFVGIRDVQVGRTSGSCSIWMNSPRLSLSLVGSLT
jgi:hypothetical protein